MQQSVASAFLEAYRRCDPLRDRSAPEHFMAFPAVVCAAFSAEVGIKELLAREGAPSNGHNLLLLFNKLKQPTRDSIIQRTGFPPDVFRANLSLAKDAFVEWRYVYEGGGEKLVNLNFMGALAGAIEAVSRGFPL